MENEFHVNVAFSNLYFQSSQLQGVTGSQMLNPWMNNYSGNFGISPDSAASPSHASAQRRDSLNSDPRLIGYGLQQIRNPQNFLYNGITSPGPVQGKILKFKRRFAINNLQITNTKIQFKIAKDRFELNVILKNWLHHHHSVPLDSALIPILADIAQILWVFRQQDQWDHLMV